MMVTGIMLSMISNIIRHATVSYIMVMLKYESCYYLYVMSYVYVYVYEKKHSKRIVYFIR